jgi:enoyl-CoA hydratase
VSESEANPEAGPDAIIEQRGHTLILTLNRPEARNALSTEMLETMVEAWDRVDGDPEIRTCILTGAGGYFCSGMDLKAATAIRSRTAATTRRASMRCSRGGG